VRAESFISPNRSGENSSVNLKSRTLLNIWKVHSAQTLRLCVAFGSHSEQRLFPQTALTGWALKRKREVFSVRRYLQNETRFQHVIYMVSVTGVLSCSACNSDQRSSSGISLPDCGLPAICPGFLVSSAFEQMLRWLCSQPKSTSSYGTSLRSFSGACPNSLLLRS
jgi:hypothetical protein